MSKAKKIIFAVTAALCVLGIGLGCFFAIRSHKESEITFTVNDTLPDGGGKKATVILLGGQSNASGCSLDEYLARHVSVEQYAAYQNGYDNVYINYLSGANQSQGFVKCASLQGELTGGFGPELGLADRLHERYPDRTFFIIKCAWGGTNLHSQWLSPSARGRTGELYRQFVAYVNTSIEYLIAKNYDVTIEGMCWMQGESDACSEKESKAYEEHLRRLIRDLRREFADYTAEDGMAFIDAYIAAESIWPYYEAVNEGKRALAASDPMTDVVDTVAAGLTCAEEPEGNPDLAHYDSMSEIRLGHLFAEHLAPFLE